MFSEIEQEEIINKFLNKIKPDEEVEKDDVEDEIKKSFITERRFEKECDEHF